MNANLERRVVRLETVNRRFVLGPAARVIVRHGEDATQAIASAQEAGAALVIVRSIVRAGGIAA